MQETNPKKSWDNIKLLSGLSKPPLLTKIHVDGAELKDGELAEALNDCFTNVTSDIQLLDFTPVDTNHLPDEYVISPESVEKALLSIKERKSNGPDWYSRTLHQLYTALYIHSSIHQLMKAMYHLYGSALMLYR